MRWSTAAAIAFPLIALGIAYSSATAGVEQRNHVSFMRGPHNMDFYRRHNDAFRIGAALHFAHGKQHDVLLLTPYERRELHDVEFATEAAEFLASPPRTEPTQEYYAPFTARAMWNVLLTIDWTHMHHEQTYDIVASRDIPWQDKKRWTDRAVRYYLEKQVAGIARSPAPLDVTMRRAAVMMKPYFTRFRNGYPRSNNFFYGAHWWHPVAYEAMMIAGNGDGQQQSMDAVNRLYRERVMRDLPLRMLLSRETMPRYSRMSPESANIFDNLHMLHGIVYDVLAYEGWTIEQQKAELYRVIAAMSYQPGDELLARKFRIPYPDLDPRIYYDWMKDADGDMTRIMVEMMEEMMPMMMPGIGEKERQTVLRQLRMKLAPGMEPGELPGSLHEALMKIVPGMKMMPGAMEPGQAAPGMVAAMLNGWHEKHGMMPGVEPISMQTEPSLPASGGAGKTGGAQ